MAKQSTIQHYSSTVTGNSPTAGSLTTGELAINVADEKIFLKNLGGTVISLSQTKDLSGAFASSARTVNSFNGATGTVLYSPAIATTSVTGVASFNSSYFTVSSGAVSLAGGYQVTGDTVSAGSGISVSRSGNTVTISGMTSSAKNTFTATQSFSAGLTFSGTITGGNASLGTIGATSLYATSVIDSPLAQVDTIVTHSATPLGIGDYTQPIVIGDYAIANNSNYIAVDDANNGIQINGSIGIGDTQDNGGAYVGVAGSTISLRPVTGALPVGETLAVTINSAYLNFGTLTLTGGVGLFSRGITALQRSQFVGGLTTANLYVAQGATFASRIQGVGATFTGTVEIDTGLILPNNQNITSAVTTFNGASGGITLTAGSNITITPSGNTFTVASTASGGGGVTTSAANTWTALQTFGNVTVNGDFLAQTVGGAEGGEIHFGLAATGTSLTGSYVVVDIYQNRLRFFEQGGGNRGYYMDLSVAAGGVGSNLAFTRSINTITTSTSAGSTASTDYVYIGATSGNINLTMPTAVSNTNRYTVKQTNTGTLTILTTSSQTIDGVTGFNLNKQYQAVDLISDNSNWIIV